MKKSNCDFIFIKLLTIISVIVIGNSFILYSTAKSEEKNLKDKNSFKGIRISTDKAVLDGNSHYTEFFGNAKVTFDGTEIQADRIKINYITGTGKDLKSSISIESIKEITADGNVKISFEDKKASTEKALYLPDKEVIVLTGENSKIISGNDYITGDKITFNKKDKTFKVESIGKKQVEAVFHSQEKKQ